MGASGSKPPKVTSHDRAVLDLKLQRDRIRQYQKKLLLLEDKERSAARQLLARGDKARALSALRRGKYQRSILTKTDSQLRTLEDLVSNIEFTQIQASVYAGLSRGNEVLKELHKELNPEAVERLMDETAAGVAYQREVDEALASRMTVEEEEEVKGEMERLEAEVRMERGETVQEEPQQVKLPDAPTTEPVASVREGETRTEESREPQKAEERQAVLA